jgi:hypothetical protein
VVDIVSEGGCGRMVPICDPVHNTGCNPLQQCDVDPNQPTTPTGLCLFGPSPEAGAGAGTCLASLFTESCPARSTCVAGACRAVCFCDSDCPSSQCCSARGPVGFNLCEPCP